jgi:hypothetical protein
MTRNFVLFSIIWTSFYALIVLSSELLLHFNLITSDEIVFGVVITTFFSHVVFLGLAIQYFKYIQFRVIPIILKFSIKLIILLLVLYFLNRLRIINGKDPWVHSTIAIQTSLDLLNSLLFIIFLMIQMRDKKFLLLILLSAASWISAFCGNFFDNILFDPLILITISFLIPMCYAYYYFQIFREQTKLVK